ncbi:hypothetical protein FPZ43_05145 [Mucilaginibacter pallidiroseus]|uniref:Lipoprotein n=1 Tax=Mucilaginibacter pallidiroseus TaxID=2599295 RepID=A0A563UG43_9SPHI|nr:hypothetical protein [Mucilaginibacter pallidiroseus]TWR30328.1 hypothetical protein FPZ43_05145 [Mucilaginibacter pallidiroseus]
MKAIKIFSAILIAGALAACGGNRNDATLGGTQDTVAKAGNGDDGSSTNGTDTSKLDSTNRGNADPSGRGSSDTLNSRPVH